MVRNANPYSLSAPGEELGKSSTKGVANNEEGESVEEPQLLEDRGKGFSSQAAATSGHPTVGEMCQKLNWPKILI